MSIVKSLSHPLCRWLLVGAVAVAPAAAAGSGASFQVAFGYVPGLEEIEAGRYDAAIEILTERREENVQPVLDDELTTLCAAYIMARRFAEGIGVCEDAVAAHDSDGAYNNRGVIRAYTGDLDGALRDFARVRVRPDHLGAFVERIKRMNPRLMATNNFDVVQRVRDHRRDPGLSLTATGADVETLD